MVSKYLLFCTNFSWWYAMNFLEYTTEICLVLKSGIFGNFVDCIICFKKHFFCQKNSVTVEIFPEGQADFFMEDSCKIIFTYMNFICQLPAYNLLWSILIKVKNSLFNQSSCMWRKNLVSTKDLVNTVIKLFRFCSTSVTENDSWMWTQQFNFFFGENWIRKDKNRNKDSFWILPDSLNAFL